MAADRSSTASRLSQSALTLTHPLNQWDTLFSNLSLSPNRKATAANSAGAPRLFRQEGSVTSIYTVEFHCASFFNSFYLKGSFEKLNYFLQISKNQLNLIITSFNVSSLIFNLTQMTLNGLFFNSHPQKFHLSKIYSLFP